jgi:hypothetical protein
VLYIQFTPKTLKQESLLKKDSTLALIDYPLGYEYEEAWFENRPELGKDEIPAYYTSVSVDRELPKGVPHKVLAEMYLPQQDEGLEGNRGSLYRTSKNEIGDFVSILLNQAFKQTGNQGLDGLGILKIDGEMQSESKFLGVGIGEKWHPEGTLRIWDDNIGTTIPYEREFLRYEYYPCDGTEQPTSPDNELIHADQPAGDCRRAIYWNAPQPEINGSYIPLEGAQVLLRDTFTIGNEITNSDGYFSFDELRGNKRYIIQWERYQYSIRNSSFFQAETRGPKQDTRWDLDIKGGAPEHYGTIHRATYHYYYKDIKNLRRPPSNSTFNTQMKIGTYTQDNDETNGSHSDERKFLGIFPRIIIYNARNETADIYGTTIHELAHASHWALDRSEFDDSDEIVKESWARGVQWALTGMEYPNYQPVYFSEYTGVVQDMIDTNSSYSYDQVSGYTIRQLEDAVKSQKSWND